MHIYYVSIQHHVHLLPLFLRLFTQVHLFIDGSFEGQYITPSHFSAKSAGGAVEYTDCISSEE